jgi:hypothetical protein
MAAALQAAATAIARGCSSPDEMFRAFDADGDGILSQAEYEVYLRGINAWGRYPYTQERWPHKWVQERKKLGCGGEIGVTRVGFEKQYGEHRQGKLITDINTIIGHQRQQMDKQLQAAGAKTGLITCSLMWERQIDLDLHCTTPTGKHISYSSKAHDSGELDVDQHGPGVENIYFRDGLQDGWYKFWVHDYSNTSTHYSPTPFTVRLTQGDQVQTRRLQHVGGDMTAFHFEYSHARVADKRALEAERTAHKATKQALAAATWEFGYAHRALKKERSNHAAELAERTAAERTQREALQAELAAEQQRCAELAEQNAREQQLYAELAEQNAREQKQASHWHWQYTQARTDRQRFADENHYLQRDLRKIRLMQPEPERVDPFMRCLRCNTSVPAKMGVLCPDAVSVLHFFCRGCTTQKLHVETLTTVVESADAHVTATSLLQNTWSKREQYEYIELVDCQSIDNPDLKERYEAYVGRMASPHEHIVFHGCADEAVEKIGKEGFQKRYWKSATGSWQRFGPGL